MGFRAYLDEDSFIDQHLITKGLRNADGFRLSTYFHKDRGGLLKAGPSWDFNLALGNASFNRGHDPVDQETTLQANGPIILDDSTWIKARTRRSAGRWGTLGTKRYLVDETPVLFISEIHYRPASASAAKVSAGFSRNDFEFLEISNPGDTSIDLRGAKFRERIGFTFGEMSIGPRESLILVKNLAAFQTRYEGFSGVTIAGEFEGNPANDRETLTLEDRDRRVLLSLTYNDAAPWPTAADEDGPSLILRSPRAPAQAGESWRASFEIGGSPGRFEWNQFNGDAGGDDNGNGISNLVEYVVGTDPIQFDTTNENVVLILLIRNPDADSAEVILQLLNDLTSADWADHLSSRVAREMNPDGTETLTFSVPAQERLFARVLVRLQ